MKKKLLFICMLLIISIIIQIILRKISFMCIILYFLILLCKLVTIEYKKFLNLRLPNIIEGKRNYDVLVIGDEKNIKNSGIISNNVLFITNYKRNLYVDFLILKRYYSFLHEKGECKFIFDFNDYRYFNSNKIDSLDYDFLHIVTLYENGINTKSIRYKLQRLLNKYKYIYYKIIKYNKHDRRKINYMDILYKIDKINDFVKERNIYVKILVKNLDYDIKAKFSNISFKEYL